MPERNRLPDTRRSVTHRFSVGGAHGYVTVGEYDDGRPGEVFVRIAKEGSTLSGLLDGWAITTSIALQHGVPLEAFVSKLAHTRFEPSGFTGGPLGYASSILDYIVRWMADRYLDAPTRASIPPGDGPPCPACGGQQAWDGNAWRCECRTGG